MEIDQNEKDFMKLIEHYGKAEGIEDDEPDKFDQSFEESPVRKAKINMIDRKLCRSIVKARRIEK